MKPDFNVQRDSYVSKEEADAYARANEAARRHGLDVGSLGEQWAHEEAIAQSTRAFAERIVDESIVFVETRCTCTFGEGPCRHCREQPSRGAHCVHVVERGKAERDAEDVRRILEAMPGAKRLVAAQVDGRAVSPEALAAVNRILGAIER
jgi:hypothetical protein